MWYESKTINETLDSLEIAIKNSTLPVEMRFCINLQTYIEKPDGCGPEQMITEFIKHPVLKNASIIFKTDTDKFYNIGDWRRDVYEQAFPYKYTVWGESDCIIPSDYFYILSQLDISFPHLVTLASRKMWDSSWDIVEHEEIEKYKRLPDNLYTAPYPLNSSDVINAEELEVFNQQFDIKVIPIDVVKIDGSLVALSSNLPTPFIPNDMNFVQEDTCAGMFFQLKSIPQYVIKTRIKGHNYSHPYKRTNTSNTRFEEVYTYYKNKSQMAMHKFITNEYNNHTEGIK
jgi:hypothetical protein